MLPPVLGTLKTQFYIVKRYYHYRCGEEGTLYLAMANSKEEAIQKVKKSVNVTDDRFSYEIYDAHNDEGVVILDSYGVAEIYWYDN